MKSRNFFSLPAIVLSVVLLGAGCGSASAPQPNTTAVPIDSVNPVPEKVNSAELPTSDPINPTPASPKSSTAPVPVAQPSPSPAPQPTPAPTPKPSPTPAPVPAPAPARRVSAMIGGFAFQPVSLSISHGDTVVWTNNDSVSHTVTADDGSFDSGAIAPGASFSHTFSAAGTVGYNCTFHPSMRGNVIVK